MTQELPVWTQNNTFSARLDRQVIKALWSEGVLSGLAVGQRGAGTNMSVDIAAGSAVIEGDDQSDQGSYLAITSVLENVAISAAPGSNSRIDLVYYRVNDPNAGGPSGDDSSFGVAVGTADPSPTVPALPTSAIPLAEILVASGTVAITDAMITPRRSAALIRGSARPGSLVAYGGAEANLAGSEDWLICDGAAISREDYFRLFNEIGTTWGSGNGSTTFNKPDLRGVVLAGKDNMGGVSAGRLTGGNVLGASLGNQNVTLTTTQLPGHTHTVSHSHTMPNHSHSVSGTAASNGAHTHALRNGSWYLNYFPVIYTYNFGSGSDGYGPNGSSNSTSLAALSNGAHTHTVSGTAASTDPGNTNTSNPTTSSTGNGAAFSIVQPSKVVNFLVRA